MEIFLSVLRGVINEINNLYLAMLNRFRNAFFNVVGGLEPLPILQEIDKGSVKLGSEKFPYNRPEFLLYSSEEEIQASADRQIRPIIVPRDITQLPWNTGYAEVINAGKSQWNEDQATVKIGLLERPEFKPNVGSNPATSLQYVYFGLFDGHAGIGASLAAAKQLHHILHEKLVDIIDDLLPPFEISIPLDKITKRGASFYIPLRVVPIENLIIGALESAFNEMDTLIGEDKSKYQLKGGCTALVALFILGKLYVANSGDSRAVLSRNNTPLPMSKDFTPESERQRIRHLAALKPELLGSEFTHLDYVRRPTTNDMGKRILYRDAFMTGWSYKIVTQEDLKIPVVYGEGKRSRVLSTIGVTRGFGDHELQAYNTGIKIKPFLLSQPEVRIFDLKKEEISETDVLIMGTDGLWDVTSNEKAIEIIQKSFQNFPINDIARGKRYTSAAQHLVNYSRGKLISKGVWNTEGKAATVDDVSVFVIPLVYYKSEYHVWLQQYEAIRGIYDSSSDIHEDFGKLSLQSSPVITKKENVSSQLEEGGVSGLFSLELADDTYDIIMESRPSTAGVLQKKKDEMSSDILAHAVYTDEEEKVPQVFESED